MAMSVHTRAECYDAMVASKKKSKEGIELFIRRHDDDVTPMSMSRHAMPTFAAVYKSVVR